MSTSFETANPEKRPAKISPAKLSYDVPYIVCSVVLYYLLTCICKRMVVVTTQSREGYNSASLIRSCHIWCGGCGFRIHQKGSWNRLSELWTGIISCWKDIDCLYFAHDSLNHLNFLQVGLIFLARRGIVFILEKTKFFSDHGRWYLFIHILGNVEIREKNKARESVLPRTEHTELNSEGGRDEREGEKGQESRTESYHLDFWYWLSSPFQFKCNSYRHHSLQMWFFLFSLASTRWA